MIESVEEFGAKQEVLALAYRKLFTQRDIKIFEAGAGQDVASRISERAGFWNFKGRRIEHLVGHAAVSVRISNQVRPVRAARAGLTVIDAQVWCQRLAGLKHGNAAELPIGKRESAERRKILEESTVMSDRNVVEITQTEAMPDVVVRQSTFAAEIRHVLKT